VSLKHCCSRFPNLVAQQTIEGGIQIVVTAGDIEHWSQVVRRGQGERVNEPHQVSAHPDEIGLYVGD
jgi:hypothetical protein